MAFRFGTCFNYILFVQNESCDKSPQKSGEKRKKAECNGTKNGKNNEIRLRFHSEKKKDRGEKSSTQRFDNN